MTTAAVMIREIPDNGGGDNTGGDTSTLTRAEAIRIQKNRISSLELDVQESEISISKLEKKASRQLITSKLDGIVTTVGDAATGTNSESDSFLAVKSKDGYYVQGTVSEAYAGSGSGRHYDQLQLLRGIWICHV